MSLRQTLCLLIVASTSFFAQDHILISEIAVTPTAGEFVEIYNPTGSTVDLSNYYLTDATDEDDGFFYYNIVTGDNAGSTSGSDFHARFPDGATIAAGEYQTVAMSGTAFINEYGENPTYEMQDTDGTIPDMREALDGSIGGSSGLSNSGEVAILYHWDGASDLVQDVDYVVWGDMAEAVDKSGVSVDGPDGDSDPSPYLDDTAIGNQIPVSTDQPHENGNSVQRVSDTEMGEVGSGGNGLTGHDETSEDLATSFLETQATPNDPPPASAPPEIANLSHTPTLPDFEDKVTISADVTDDIGVSLVELTYSVDGGTAIVLTMSNSAGDTYEATVPAQAENSVVEYFVEAVDTDDQNTISETNSYTVVGEIELTAIADIQADPSAYLGQIVSVRGIVTLGAGITTTGWTSAYVQDSSGRGINVFQSPDIDPNLVRGNEVEITGTVDEFNGITEILDYASSVVSTGNAIPNPLSISTNEAVNSTELEGTYVEAAGTIVDIFNTDNDNFNVTIDDGSGEAVARIWGDTGIDLGPFSVGQELTIRGVYGIFNSAGQLVPGYQDELSAPGVNPGDGSGTASVSPGQVNPGDAVTATVTVNGETGYELATLSVTIPSDWGWDGSASVSGAGLSGATVDASGNLLTVSGATITDVNSGDITLSNLTAPNTDVTSVFVVRTATADGSLLPIGDQPAIVVGEGGAPTVPISDIQGNSSFLGQNVTVSGVVTLGAGITTADWTTAYIQDGSGAGINIFSFDFVDPNIVRGNLVEVSGTVDEFNGVTEIVDYVSTVISTGNAIPDPLEISTSEATNSIGLEGTYIQTTGIINEIFGNLGGGTNVTINDGTGDAVIRVWDDTGIELGQFSVGDEMLVRGVYGIFDNSGQVVPGYQDELEEPGVLPGDGSGSASVSPGQVDLSDSLDLTVTIAAAGYALESVSVKIPGDWAWGGELESVVLADGLHAGAISIEGNSIIVSGASIAEDFSGSLTILGVTAPDRNTTSIIDVQTATAGGKLGSISSLPQVTVGAGGTPLLVSTIEEIQDNEGSFLGKAVTVVGTITLGAGIISTSGTDAYIQDVSGRGINLFSFDPPDPILERGNKLVVTGTIDEFGGILEIVDFGETMQLISTDNPIPEPLFVSTNIASDVSLEGTYFKVVGIVDEIERSGDAFNITLTDDRGSVTVRVWDTTELNLSFIQVDDTLQVQAVMDVFSGSSQLIPGYQDELVVPGETSRADGSGFGMILTAGLNVAPGDTVSSISLALVGELDVPITGLHVDVPRLWGWNDDSTTVSVSGEGAEAANVELVLTPFDSVARVSVSNLDVTGGDTLEILLENLIAPDDDIESVIWMRTQGEGGRFSLINSPPRLDVGAGTRTLIYDLQTNSSAFGGEITVHGVTTVGAGLLRETSSTGDSLTTAYIQDESGRGINLFRFGLIEPLLVRGYEVEVSGTVTEFGGITEIEYDDISLIDSEATLPTPIYLTNSEANSPRWDGTLIATEGVILEKFSAGGGTTLEIGDGEGATNARIWDTAQLDLSEFDENSRIFIEGVGGLFVESGGDSIYQLLPVYADQISLDPDYSPSLDNVNLSVEPHPFAPDRGERIEIAYNAGAVNNRITIRIFDMGGRLVTTLLDENAQILESSFEWDGRDRLRDFVPLGAYICHLEVVEPITGSRRQKMAPIVVGTLLK